MSSRGTNLQGNFDEVGSPSLSGRFVIRFTGLTKNGNHHRVAIELDEFCLRRLIRALGKELYTLHTMRENENHRNEQSLAEALEQLRHRE